MTYPCLVIHYKDHDGAKSMHATQVQTVKLDNDRARFGLLCVSGSTMMIVPQDRVLDIKYSNTGVICPFCNQGKL